MQLFVLLGFGKGYHFVEHLFRLEMDIRIAFHRVDYRPQYIFNEIVLRPEIQRVYCGRYAAVLVVDYRYAKDVFRLPDDEHIVVEPNLTRFAGEYGFPSLLISFIRHFYPPLHRLSGLYIVPYIPPKKNTFSDKI